MKRRSFLVGGLATLFAAPAIVRAASLMPIRVFDRVEIVYSPWEVLARRYELFSLSYSDWRGLYAAFPTPSEDA